MVFVKRARMKIAEVESLIAGGSQYVRITTDDGTTGVGQSGCWAYPEAVHGVMPAFRRYLVGEDPLRIEHHWSHLYRMGPFRGSVIGGAVSAVDIALWDIKGKRFQAPIWELLGGRCRDRVRIHLLLEAGGSAGAIAAAAAKAAADGYTAVKFDPIPENCQDLSQARLIADTVEVVDAARTAVGADVDLVLELHRKLTPLQALPLIHELARFHPLFVEDPIQIDSIQTQAEIAARVPVPLANGERLNTIWEFRELLARGGSQYVRPDLGLAGGLTHCKKIAAIAESHHAAIVSHNFLGPVLTAASVHLAIAVPNVVTQEYIEQDERHHPDAFRGRIVREGGYLLAPEAPGLGIELDETKLGEPFPGNDIQSLPRRADGSIAYAV
jgi:galactonate dehydratase